MIITRAIAAPFVLYTLFNFATTLLEVPTTRLLEHAICVRHFNDPRVGEAACKTGLIQGTLSSVIGWKLTLDAFAGILTALFYGSLAERRGEKVVLLLSTIGYITMQLIDVGICSIPLILPIQMVWSSSLFLLVGGGQRVFNSMVFTLLSGQLDDNVRTQYMYWLALGPHCTRFISPRIAAALMKVGLFTPFWLSFGSLCIILAVVLSMSAKTAVQANQVSGPDYSPIEDTEDSDHDSANTTSSNSSPQPTPVRRTSSSESLDPYERPRRSMEDFRDNIQRRFHRVAVIIEHPVAAFVLGAVFLKKIGFASSVFAFQYVSERFGWELRDTTWLRVVSGVGAVVVTVAAPLATSRLIRQGYAASSIDLNVIRCALGMLLVSFVVTWKATSGLLILISMFGIGLGEALEPALQGLISFAAESSEAATVFTTYAFFDAAAELVAGPLTARLMAIGRTEDHPSDGICFLASSIMFGVLLLWAALVKLNNRVT